MLTLPKPSASHPLIIGGGNVNLHPAVQTLIAQGIHPAVAAAMVNGGGVKPTYQPGGMPLQMPGGEKIPAAPGIGGSSHEDMLKVIAALQAIGVDITQLNNNMLGARRQDRGKLDDYAPKPLQITYSVNNKAGAGAGVITAFAFNEDFLQATPTDNGSGAGSVEKTYSDGFSGNLVNQIAQSYGVEGIPVKQLQMTATDNTTGAQDKAALLLTNPRKITYNGDQTSANQFIPISSTGDPIYNQQGFLIIDIETRIRRFEQVAMTIQVNKTVTAIYVMG